MQAVVALAGEIHDSLLVRSALDGAGLIVAADSGANRLRQLGILPHVVIGDLDSLRGDDLFNLKAVGVEFEPHPDPEQRTDGDVAIEYALRRGATQLIIVGLFGGPRYDHEVANLYLLMHPSLRQIPAWTVDGWTALTVLNGDGISQAHFHGEVGDYVTITAVSERVEGITTVGLKWPLSNATFTRGLNEGTSNELINDRAMIQIAKGTAFASHHFRSERLP
ncbi:MAG: thiamine diphosphokinase [Chloroflexi bacterium]|nr:thiamine diphosphokinase [Chloroflexota bacterium]